MFHFRRSEEVKRAREGLSTLRNSVPQAANRILQIIDLLDQDMGRYLGARLTNIFNDADAQELLQRYAALRSGCAALESWFEKAAEIQRMADELRVLLPSCPLPVEVSERTERCASEAARQLRLVSRIEEARVAEASLETQARHTQWDHDAALAIKAADAALAANGDAAASLELRNYLEETRVLLKSAAVPPERIVELKSLTETYRTKVLVSVPVYSAADEDAGLIEQLRGFVGRWERVLKSLPTVNSSIHGEQRPAKSHVEALRERADELRKKAEKIRTERLQIALVTAKYLHEICGVDCKLEQTVDPEAPQDLESPEDFATFEEWISQKEEEINGNAEIHKGKLQTAWKALEDKVREKIRALQGQLRTRGSDGSLRLALDALDSHPAPNQPAIARSADSLKGLQQLYRVEVDVDAIEDKMKIESDQYTQRWETLYRKLTEFNQAALILGISPIEETPVRQLEKPDASRMIEDYENEIAEHTSDIEGRAPEILAAATDWVKTRRTQAKDLQQEMNRTEGSPSISFPEDVATGSVADAIKVISRWMEYDKGIEGLAADCITKLELLMRDQDTRIKAISAYPNEVLQETARELLSDFEAMEQDEEFSYAVRLRRRRDWLIDAEAFLHELRRDEIEVEELRKRIERRQKKYRATGLQAYNQAWSDRVDAILRGAAEAEPSRQIVIQLQGAEQLLERLEVDALRRAANETAVHVDHLKKLAINNETIRAALSFASQDSLGILPDLAARRRLKRLYQETTQSGADSKGTGHQILA